MATSIGSREIEPMIFKMQEGFNDESLSTDGEIDGIVTTNDEDEDNISERHALSHCGSDAKVQNVLRQSISQQQTLASHEESFDIHGGWNWKRNSAECSDNIFLPLSLPAWAELQRCRHLSQEPDSLLNALQAESGCQIHVDRYFQAVKVVGLSANLCLLRHLLENFEQVCSQEVVPLATLPCVQMKNLSMFALKLEVTLHVTSDQLLILGLLENVKDAVTAIRAQDWEALSDEVDAETSSEVSVILKLPQLLQGSNFRHSSAEGSPDGWSISPVSVSLERVPPGLVKGRAPVEKESVGAHQVCYICFKNPPFPQPYFKWPKSNIGADSLMFHFC